LLVEELAGNEPFLLLATGSYQLTEMRRAALHLRAAGYAYRLVYVQEPGRFRAPRDQWEAATLASATLCERLFPSSHKLRVMLTHMRPEVARGHLWRLFPDVNNSVVLGYRNRGGTLDEAGMLFANNATWAHILLACARLRNVPLDSLLSAPQIAAVQGQGDPLALR
jgi:phosphoketolase